MAAKYDIKLYQGDSYSLTFTLDGNYTSYTHTFKVALGFTGSNTLTLTNAFGDGITSTWDGTNTICTISLTPAQTAALFDTSVYAYDYQISTGSTYALTLLYGSLTMTGEMP